MSLMASFPDHWPLCDDCGHIMPESATDPTVFHCLNCGATKPHTEGET